MTATTSGRNTRRRNADKVVHPVNAGVAIYAGTLVALLAAGGYAVPAGTAAAGIAVGVAETDVINMTGLAGDLSVEVNRGCFQFANSAASDLITRADIGNACYIVDNQTVAKTDNSAARKAAGTIVDVDANGVWVDVG